MKSVRRTGGTAFLKETQKASVHFRNGHVRNASTVGLGFHVFALRLTSANQHKAMGVNTRP